jgi:hypothetical protein
MKQGKTLLLGAAAAVLLAAGVFFSLHRSSEQADLGGGTVFADLETSLGNVGEIRLSKGDGSRTTLRKDAGGWTVVERQFPADALRVRELALALANLRVVERKTQDPANYAKLGVENPDTPTATSTLVEVVAGQQTWSLIVGKGADGRAVYVRKPTEAVSLLASPLVIADPDQKRWLDRLIVDLPGADVHEISARVGKGPAYLLSRPQRSAPELTLTPVPRGRSAVSTMSLSGQAEALVSLNFDDLRAAPASAPSGDTVTYRTFDGQVITFSGRREGEKAFVTLSASRDAALAAKFAPAAAAALTAPGAPAPATPAAPSAAAPAAAAPAVAAPAPAAEPSAQSKTVERLASRTQGLEFEIPVYKYEAIFRPYEDLLEKKN